MTEDKWDGERYRNNSAPQEKFALVGIERLALAGHERVIDVGCGDGKITAEIARRLPRGRAFGIDASPSMITACNREYGDRPNLSFRVADATSFVVDEPFDAAVSFSALHWVEDLRAAIGQIRDALRPGGTLIIGMGGAHQKEFTEVFERARLSGLTAGKPRSFHGRTDDDLSSILMECGFVDVRVDAIDVARPYPNDQALLDWIMAWLPHATGLSGRDALSLGQEIVDNVRVSQPNGLELVLHSTMLSAQAKRV